MRLRELRGQAPDEVAERLAVARERGQRDPLVRPVMAPADRPELDRRDARPRGTRSRPTRRRGRSTARRPRPSSRPPRAARARTGSCARRSPARARSSARSRRRRSRGSGRGSRRGPGRAGSGCRRPSGSGPGTLLKASPPSIRARLIDGRSKRSDDSRLNGSVSIRRKTSCALRIALSPSHGVEPCAARPLTSTRDREHALRLDADVQLGRLAGDREVGAAELLADEPVRRAVLDVLGLLVRDADEAHAHGVLRGGVVDGAHHRRERALHVVGAAPDQPVALDTRLELLLERRAPRRGGRAARRAGRSSRRPRRGSPACRRDRCGARRRRAPRASP